MNKYDILVLVGGSSEEFDISLETGKNVVACLKDDLKQSVEVLDVSKIDLVKYLLNISKKPDLVFNALHGKFFEDGKIQAILEYFNIPYTHSGVCASAIAMNKRISYLIADAIGLKYPLYQVMHYDEYIAKKYWGIHIIKPICSGSSVGVKLIKSSSDKDDANAYLSSEEGKNVYDKHVMVQEFIQGIELTVPVLFGVAMECIEIDHNGNFFGNKEKYDPEAHNYKIFHDKVVRDITCGMAEKMHSTIGCNGITRSDFIYDPQIPEYRGIYYLETNTQPGLGEVSIIPSILKAKSISLKEILSVMIQSTIIRE
ncbi:D-alanine--D-alanine ligase family protein [Candidatus Gromoviella agglomerans]|uniref:D-alanine--D-alanine ligase family protein n=1 Tax=Candidatus Gromoviella agglomerans TaxID=2806609 RepID=UPI001E5C1232|nr:ATP-grasp domain-containing protein [Candidatus Gromoviella agglomerans]UFX98219.1 D-alanine--D-alanine ligase [Candidatus Gromoviella agglomerans]